MLNESNKYTVGGVAGFKVKVKGSGDGGKYLTSEDNGATCSWSTSGTPLCLNGTQTSPKTWTYTRGSVTKYLGVTGTAVHVSGASQDTAWQDISNDDKILYQGSSSQYVDENAASGAAILVLSGGTLVEFEAC